MNTSPAIDIAVTRIVRFFETLTPASLADIAQVYAPDARFKDPFNDVRGHAAITGIFAHMFDTLEAPRFIVRERIVQGSQCFLAWEFHFRFRRFQQGQTQVIRGGSHLVLDATGHVTLHRDYWDAAEELYEKLPLVGGLMRWLKKRANS
ncbi:nuclear transport factor 2 family protein [uncultured Rhodoferax sp.]|uniref:nuclear transport factor 2 family protein n=1 Tax=uncultured Rhodoferax sp. TaxID=223188 RepID=UPI0025E5E4AA|nr:nuclear transport factor 2 family protein [uncultured Rhodoferax sp.]